ncbi:hypothetical protein [Texcoconibacillus texcoconensis]|uniref:Stage II sporulation protein B n=1 Tax=Texcoconibacillus texcoconensis TaxID=1095777 RepID=A0A840QSX8_9BACI|nr:hypothetical protein [Texcoconibacillus texcoconensis]MBB5174391.1 stage II sporulation protein B [Texcoconibacillus texcoconensis]
MAYDPRISVRLNGEQHQFKERKEANSSVKGHETMQVELAEQQTDSEGTSIYSFSSNDDAQEEKKNVIDFEERRDKHERDNEPYWDDGKSEKSPKLPPFARKKRRGKPWTFELQPHQWRTLGIVFGAVFFGLVLGSIILSLFTSNELSSEASGGVNMTDSQGGTVASAVDGGHEDGYLVPARSFTVVQGGAFSDIETGKTYAESIQERGGASTLVLSEDTTFMYIGVAKERDEVGTFMDYYAGQGQETYVKEHETPKIAVEDEELAEWLYEGGERLVGLAKHGGHADEPIDVDHQALEEWYDQAIQLEGSGGEWKDQYITQLVSAVITGYKTSESDEMVNWSFQQAVLDGLASYDQLVHSL